MLRADSANQAVLDATNLDEPNFAELFQEWLLAEGLWWLSSCLVHLCLCCLLAFLSVTAVTRSMLPVPQIDTPPATAPSETPPDFKPLEIPEPDDIIAFPMLELENVTPNSIVTSGMDGTDASSNEPPGADIAAGPSSGSIHGNSLIDFATPGRGGALVRKGDGNPDGSLKSCSGGKNPYGGRGKLKVPKATDLAVTGALNWIARHQLSDGHWSMQNFNQRCSGNPCSDPGTHKADTAATAMGLLPFLAAGQTHIGKKLYSKTVELGLRWLVQNQKADGDLRGGASMYAHALATIALCEAYGMSNDRSLEYPARRAVAFIVRSQNTTTGGWRYEPGEEGDTSVLGWQVMALKSAQMANISVDPSVFTRSQKYLRSVASGRQGSRTGGQFAYQPGGAPTPSMTSVGLLCLQYMGTARNDAAMVDGTAALMQNIPNAQSRDVYYWYYASQVMHNQPGAAWDAWNRKTRRILTESQQRTGCEAGSGDPKGPTPDRWGEAGGRLMMTSLSALTLEVYYRYLPLYKTDAEELMAVKTGSL